MYSPTPSESMGESCVQFNIGTPSFVIAALIGSGQFEQIPAFTLTCKPPTNVNTTPQLIPGIGAVQQPGIHTILNCFGNLP